MLDQILLAKFTFQAGGASLLLLGAQMMGQIQYGAAKSACGALYRILAGTALLIFVLFL